MIPPLPGWSVSQGANGTLLVSPEGIDAAHVRYEERLRPLRSPRRIVSAHLAKVGVAACVSDAEYLVTDEGENAALLTVRSAEGPAMQRDIGFIFAEDSYASVSSVATREALFERSTEIVRTLVTRSRQWLGRRRRRVLYRPPPAWHGVARGLEAHWYAPAFPREAARIIVWPAIPEPDADLHTVFADLLAGERAAGFECDHVGAPEMIQSRRGLAFRVLPLSRAGRDDPGAVRALAVASDARYIYVVRLETTSDGHGAAHQGALRDLLSTVHTVPHTRARVPLVTFSHWAE